MELSVEQIRAEHRARVEAAGGIEYSSIVPGSIRLTDRGSVKQPRSTPRGSGSLAALAEIRRGRELLAQRQRAHAAGRKAPVLNTADLRLVQRALEEAERIEREVLAERRRLGR